MKTNISIRLSYFLVAFSLLLITSCKKENSQNDKASGLIVYNMITDKAGVGIAINGNNFVPPPLEYTGFSGPYRAVQPGVATIETFDYFNGNVLAQFPAQFKDSAYYSLFAMGNNESYQNVFVEDRLSTLPRGTGNAYIRFVNAIPDPSESNVIVTNSGNVVLNVNGNYGTVSEFQPVLPGNLNVSVVNANHTIDATRSFTVKKDEIYTVLFAGVPLSVDTTRNIKILYNQNGLVAP